MSRTLLIVDDNSLNREILKNILRDEFDIMEAAHGAEAVDVMEEAHKRLSAVLLDLRMPVMDGFEVLSYMQRSEALSQLPVIVTTGQTDTDSEERALKLGAKDYIAKPYKSTIIKQRIRNTINLRETAATVNALQRDRLTGLYSREAFFDKVRELVAAHESGYYIMAGFDIDKFKVINDQYGTEKGDEVLRYIAGVFNEGFHRYGGICCRMASDDFAVLYPACFSQSEELENIRRRAGMVEGIVAPVTFSIGRYVINDLSLSPSAMYDRAMLAAESIKGRYDMKIVSYDESMRDHLIHEQKIVTEMVAALHEGQFEIWYQPQYNHATGALIGAEALVRWRHPEQGVITPGVFIPVFEQNGFIYELDKYIWKEACRTLRETLDAGGAPLPVSVNISRYDVFCPDIIESITRPLKEYRLPVDLLRLEITESAFAESGQHIVDIVKTLIDYGFTVEIDDFGSGYSSLNTLKDVPAQILKLDMKFLESSSNSQRGGNILESIVRMSKWLGMSVIAEGVETVAQADFLKSIGCSYVQGYLYAKPMPRAEYAALCARTNKEERLITLETVENMDNDSFWDPRSMDTLIFNSYVGAACVFEYYHGALELLRVTEKFAQMVGGAGMTVADALRLDWMGHMTPDARQRMIDNLAHSMASKQETSGEYVFKDLPYCTHEVYLRSTMRVIASAGERALVYCTNEDITAQRQAEQREHKVSSQLQTVMNDIPGGFCRIRVCPDGELRTVYYNLGLSQLVGMTDAQMNAFYGENAMAGVHPDDMGIVQDAFARMLRNGEAYSSRYRLLNGRGEYIWLSIFGRTSRDAAGETYLNIYYMDATKAVREEEQRKELLDNLPGGAALYEYDGEKLHAIHINRRYWELVERKPPVDGEIKVLDALHPDDRDIAVREVAAAIRQSRDTACDLRVRDGSGAYRPFHVVGRIVPRPDGKYAIYASYTRISDETMSIQKMLPVALRAMMREQTGFSFVKDREGRYICCSREMYEAAGLSGEDAVVGKTDFDILEKETAERYWRSDQRVLESGTSELDLVDIVPNAEGKERYASTSKYPLKDSQGHIIGLYGIGRDITEDRTMKSRLELLTSSIPGGMATFEPIDGEIRLRFFNDGFGRLFGLTREEYDSYLDSDVSARIFPEDRPQFAALLDAFVHGDAPLDCCCRVRLRDGSYKWISLKAAFPEGDKKRKLFHAVLFDVTAQQEAAERLRVSEEENRLAMEHSKSVVCRYNVAARSLTVSSSANPIFHAASVMMDVPYGQVRQGHISPETAEIYTGFYESILRGEKSGEAVFQRRASTGWRWLKARFSTIFSNDGQPVSAVISLRDVTESMEKEEVYRKWRQSVSNKTDDSYSFFRCTLCKETMADTAAGGLLNVSFAPGVFHFDERTEQYASQYVLEEDRDRFRAFLRVDALLAAYYQGRRTAALEYREHPAAGRQRWLRLSVELVEHPHSAAVEAYLLFENIDGEKRGAPAADKRAEGTPLPGASAAEN